MSTTLVQMPEKIELEQTSTTPTFGRFFVQPLEKGFGVTIGDSFAL